MAKLYEPVLLALSFASLIQAHALPDPAAFNLSPRQDTSSIPRPALGSVPYGVAITTCTVPGTVALTFDDGPGPYTAQLLDTLAANGAKATFFVLGNQTLAGSNAALISRMYKEGHQIASHTYDHQSLEAITSAQRIIEMTQNESILKNILGFFPTYMRPPYGFCYSPSGCLSDMGKLGYHVITWNVDTKDYMNDDPSLIQNSKNIWDGAFNAGNVQTSTFLPLTHDVHYQTVNNLAPYMIAEIKQKGYKMVTVGDCLGDPSQNWYRNTTTGGVVIQNKVVSSPQASSSSSSSSSASLSSSLSSGSASSSTATSARVVSSSASSANITSSASRSSTSSAALSSGTSSSSTSSTSAQATRASAASQLSISFVLYGMIAMLFMLINV